MQRRLQSECLPNSTPGTKLARAWGTTPIPLLFALILALGVRHSTRRPSLSLLRDYAHTVCTQQGWVPLGAIYTILQTAVGYSWIFTGEGLLRFDGMRFVSLSTPCVRRRETVDPRNSIDSVLYLLVD